ncbi:MAG: SRPBCC family protein [Solirubrobacterales bacterium]
MNSQSDELRLNLSATLDAPPPVVFTACTEPDELAKWWGPAGFTSPSVELDVRPGGRYRIAMQPPDGELFHLSGEFREVDPPTRLSYTFEWEEPDPDDQRTIVTLSFKDLGDSTELSLGQGPFATEARRALHEAGWSDSLTRLREVCRAPD